MTDDGAVLLAAGGGVGMGVVLGSSTKLSFVEDIQFCQRFSVLLETNRRILIH